AGGWLCPHAAKTKAAKATKSVRRMNHLRCDRRNNRVAGALGENGAPEVLPAPRWPTVRSASAETEDAPAPHRQIGRVIFSVPRPCCRRFFALPRMPRQGLRTASTLPGWQAGEGVSLALDAIIIVSFDLPPHSPDVRGNIDSRMQLWFSGIWATCPFAPVPPFKCVMN